MNLRNFYEFILSEQGKKKESDFDGGWSYSSSHYHRNHHLAVKLEAPWS